jgi:hypothetical protein
VVIRSVLAYELIAWHNMGEGFKGFSKLLISTQNKCFRIVNGAYKTTPTRYFELKMAIPPFDLYLNKWVANFKHRIKAFEMSQLLRGAGAKAAEMVAGRRHQHRRKGPELTSRNQRIQAVRR